MAYTDPMQGNAMLSAQAPGTWVAGMLWNGVPITAAQAAQLNRVSALPDNPTYNDWGGVLGSLAQQGGATGQAAYGANPTGAIPGWNGAPGTTLPASTTPGAAPPPGGPVAPPPPPGWHPGGPTPPPSDGLHVPAAPPPPIPPAPSPGGAIAPPPGGMTTPGGGTVPSPTTLGNLAGGTVPGGNLSIPGGQPNYPLNIGSYLNPLMQYALANGVNAINNSAASSGLLRSGNTLKDLMAYGLGVGANNFNNAANIAAGQQGFAYGVDNNDRNFAYNASVNDRNFNLQSALAEAGLGLSATGQMNNNSQELARIIAQNLLLQGQANAGGTIGGSNAISNAISQTLAMGSGNMTLAQLQKLIASGGMQ